MFLRTRAYKIKSIHIFLFLSLIICNTMYSQDIAQHSDRGKDFSIFLNLFQPISNVDSLPVIHRIHYSDYPSKLIDTSFYSFVCSIPFFYPYATFKVERNEGFLVCIHQVFRAELTDFQFVELLSFNKQGCLLDRVALPYLKVGCIAGPGEYAYEATLSVSTSEVHVIMKKYEHGRDKEIIEKHHFYINEDATLLSVPINE